MQVARRQVLPEIILCIIWEYAESYQKEFVLADIQQISFVRGFLGYRRVEDLTNKLNSLGRIYSIEVHRKVPRAIPRNYGQNRFIDTPVQAKQKERKVFLSLK